MSSESRRKRRAAILEAAKEEFSAQGFALAKIEEIARRAGIGKSTVYEYFPSKDQLLESVLQDSIVNMHKKLEEFLSQPLSLRDKLAEMFLSASKSMQGLIHTTMRQSEGCGPMQRFLREHGEAERDRLLTTFETMVEEAKARHEIRQEVDTRLVAVLILSMTMSMTSQLLQNDDGHTIRKAVALLFEGLQPVRR